MSEPSAELVELAREYGVATDYWDWRGNHVLVSAETVVAVLAALGVDASSRDAVRAAVEQTRRYRWTRMLPRCVVTRPSQRLPFFVHVTAGQPVDVWIESEADGSRHDLSQGENQQPPQHIDGRLVGEATFVVPAGLPVGYHTLRVRSAGEQASTLLVVAPDWLGIPALGEGERAWGFATQLYSIRSTRSWGVGDLVDLADLAMWSGAELGAGFLLVNPLHAAQPVPPMEPSPYLPTTRRYANPLYLRVEQVPEYAYLDPAARATVEKLGADLATGLGGVDRIDRDTAWRAKRAALELLYAAPRSSGREVAYRAFRRRGGAGLEDFATWCALAEVHGPSFPAWPEALRQPRSDAVAAFRASNEPAVDFHRWLQWLLDEQLANAQHAARDAGMPLGVMHDLAVGVAVDGADAWSLQDLLAQGITVGAPPDPFNQLGQDWLQPPWRPDRLADAAYAPFRDLVSSLLWHAGGLRIDHVMGLFRLWWIPAGMPPTAGTYVRYDHEALVGILSVEAYRAGAVVVGEDLGTVEPWVRDYLRERGVLGTSVLWFERDYDGDGRPLAPERWREYCLASVTTHDLPPTAGYLAGDHVRLRHSLGLLARPLEEELAADQADRSAWLDELHRRGLATVGAGVEETVVALHRFLRQTPSRLLCVSLADAVGDRRIQNQPGTTDEYPNWRLPLAGADGTPMLLEDVIHFERAARLAAAVRTR